MKVLVTGTQYIDSYKYFKELMITALKDVEPSLILCGTNEGADALAQRYAKEYNIPVKAFIRGPHDKDNKNLLRRNKEMLKEAEMTVLFWSNKPAPLVQLAEMSMKRKLKTIIFELHKPRDLTNVRKHAITTTTQTEEEI